MYIPVYVERDRLPNEVKNTIYETKYALDEVSSEQ